MSDISKRILRVLKDEKRWLSFDELYTKIQTSYDWIAVSSHLEYLVETGKVQYVLPYGADVGCYAIRDLK
ncbi:MAG: hypothetical protein K2N43_02140 [Lachnospiraceae bacterium]|nr:hypothetical protein [Lachnospiraceae bacterium]